MPSFSTALAVAPCVPPPHRICEIRSQAFAVVDALTHLTLPADVPPGLAAQLVVEAQSLAHHVGELERCVCLGLKGPEVSGSYGAAP